MTEDQTAVASSGSATFSEATAQFGVYLYASGCSPNTARAYSHDLTHLRSFLVEQGVEWRALTPALAVDLLIHLRGKPSRRRGATQYPSLATIEGERVARLSTATINRVLTAVSSFYEWARITERFDGPNPITRIHDRAAARVSERYRPFLTGIAAGSPTRSPVRLRQVHRVPRPMATNQVDALLAQLRCRRDLAMIRLMLDGGLRPGEALGLHLADIAYGRRRVTIRGPARSSARRSQQVEDRTGRRSARGGDARSGQRLRHARASARYRRAVPVPGRRQRSAPV